MSSLPTHTPRPPERRRKSAALTLIVDLEPSDETGLLRVISTLARRRCRVRRVAFAVTSKHSTATKILEVDLDPPARHRPESVVAWIAALVPVRSVTAV